MPFKIVDKLEDVPEPVRTDYRLQDGKYIPVVSEDHPLKKKLKELSTETAKFDGEKKAWEAEKAAYEAKVIPSGQRAIPLEEFRLLEEVKGLGPIEEIKTKLKDYPKLKEAEETRSQEEALTEAAEFLKYENPNAFLQIAKAMKITPTFKKEKIDDKDVRVPYVEGKKLSDYITETPALKLAEISFKTRPTTTAPSTEAGSGTRSQAATGTTAPPAAGGKDAPATPTYRFQDKGDVAWTEN